MSNSAKLNEILERLARIETKVELIRTPLPSMPEDDGPEEPFEPPMTREQREALEREHKAQYEQNLAKAREILYNQTKWLTR